MKLALGTVQFGLPYGVANATGQLSLAEASATINLARGAGIRVLDTASAYGESERTLGQIGVQDFDVVTKLPPLPLELLDVTAWVREKVQHSLRMLRVPRLSAVLLHRSTDGIGPRGDIVRSTLEILKQEGLVSRIGVSVYVPEELDACLGLFPLDVVQAPFNVFDRRIVRSGWAKRLHDMGSELHVRSVFLQGILLLAPTDRPARFNRWQAAFASYDEWIGQLEINRLQVCVQHALAHPLISRVVVGVDGRQHLSEVLAAFRAGTRVDSAQHLEQHDPVLLSPARWSELSL